MSTSSYDSVFAFGTTTLAVPVGATNAVLITPTSFQLATTLRYLAASGGTLEIIGVPMGSTLTAAQLVSQSGHGFPVAPESYFPLGGPSRFYVNALGTGTSLAILMGLSQAP